MTKANENLNQTEVNLINENVKEVKKIAEDNKKIENETVEFKELSELTENDISKLGKVPIIIRKTYYKKSKRIAYEIEVKLHEYLTIKNNIKESEYYLLLLEFKLDKEFAEHSLIARCRFVTGINKNGNEYHQIELYFSKELYYSNLWLNGSDLRLFKKVLPNVKFLERTKLLDLEDTINYYEE